MNQKADDLTYIRSKFFCMALLSQWIRQRPWMAAGFAGATSTAVNIASGFITAAGAVGAMAVGSISTRFPSSEHPQRRRILRTLDEYPGLCYRELQAVLNAANGTLRHHLDVLQQQKAITVVPVNGRTCYFAGMPSQIEELRGAHVGMERAATYLPIGLSTVQKSILESIELDGVPKSQAQLARRLGRTRATVHSAVKVLRRRGILHEDVLDVMPHIDLSIRWTGQNKIDYEAYDDRYDGHKI
jgi:DNA-binding transcriptional ArsR family regulator